MDRHDPSPEELAQPTRARIFTLLGGLDAPAATGEVAQRLGLHPNGVRLHLEVLERGGLVRRERVRHGRGRPRDVWSVAPGAVAGGDERTTAYADLARWLVRAIVDGRLGARQVEATGRRIGRDLVSVDPGAGAEPALFGALAALGFAPRRERPAPGHVRYCLGRCPYRDVVPERQTVVCGLHRGLTRGMLDAVDPRARLVGFVAKDPATAGCEIEVRGPLAGGGQPPSP
jgi:predicted ArsR family transcriptional regulator